MKYDRDSYGNCYENVATVNQGEVGISSSESKTPILATSGLGPCISLSGWSPEQKIGFLTHWDTKYNSLGTFPVLCDKLLNGSNEPIEFEVRIVGGEKGYSESDSEYRKEHMEIINSFIADQNWKLVEEDSGEVLGRFLDPQRNQHIPSLENNFYVRSIALDCRTGQALPYKDCDFFERQSTRSNSIFDYREGRHIVDCVTRT